MSEQTWTFHDKSTWGGGPWQSEPDKVQWMDAETGLPCLAVRNSLGNWCGYVGVAEGHPLYKVDYSACPQFCGEAWCQHSPKSTLDAHGGITYSDACQEDSRPHGICHIPEPGQPDHVWWFGFDCAHAGDFVPGMFAGIPMYMPIPDLRGDIYRDLAYVQGECARLAAQLI